MKTNLRLRTILLSLVTGVFLFNLAPATLEAQWSQMGSDIEGVAINDQLGNAVDVNADGTSIVVGAHYNDGIIPLGTNVGQVRVFDWDGMAWIQRGVDIYGSMNSDQSGWALSIDTAGMRIAISAIYNDGPDDLSTSMGEVRVFDWNGSSWVQAGANIYGEAAGDVSGSYITLSSNGNRLAIGAVGNDDKGTSSGQVRVYDWNGSAWVQVGNDIDGDTAEFYLGESVALSPDGKRLAIGAPGGGAKGINTGLARVYEIYEL
jgi:hypothetical protein